MEAPEPRIGSVARDESNTPMSQPTPPPVDGLPRFSSSPAPIVAAQQGRASLSALHISNLTTGNTRFTARPPEPVAEEPRKASVSKINELLNDEPAAIEPAAADWFNEAPSQEDEATGIAALALASMMGRRTPEPRAEQRNTLSVAYPQPRAYMPHRPSDPLPPIAAASQPIHTAPSAFSPVAMSRPQSVDPAYAHSPHVRVMSPAPVQPLQQHQRQRKPSAPPLPPPSGPFVSHPPGYVGYPGSQSLRPVYPHGSSPQVPAQTVYQESEYPPRFGDPPRAYTSGQQMPRPAYYYPMSPSQQQQQIQQQQQQQQHPSSNAGPPAYSGYRPQRPYQPPPPM
ncbi:hypothetical protein IWW50_007018 [Coemansia erecta]|nr:hypothetical protein GGF43_006837 [Coemansia sp. RSA 2618]KAJ2814813.1 hypothetical protein IWW50_007018 [Coemansia erecta]